MQLMEFCKKVFELEGLDIYLRPYQIVRYIYLFFLSSVLLRLHVFIDANVVTLF